MLPFEQAAATNSALALQAAALFFLVPPLALQAAAFAFLAPQASNGRFRLTMAVRSAHRGAPPLPHRASFSRKSLLLFALLCFVHHAQFTS